MSDMMMDIKIHKDYILATEILHLLFWFSITDIASGCFITLHNT